MAKQVKKQKKKINGTKIAAWLMLIAMVASFAASCLIYF